MATGLLFKDLDVTTDIDSLLGAAESASSLVKGKKFTYSKDGTLTSNSDAIVSTQKAVKTYADTKAADNTVVHLAGTEIVTGSKTFSGTVNMSALSASQLLATDGSKNVSNLTALPNGTTAITQTAGDNSTKVSTTAYVDNAVSGENLWDRTGTTLSAHTAGDDVSTGTGGFKDNDVTTAVALGDSLNTSFATTNKTIIGSVNEVKGSIPSVPAFETSTSNIKMDGAVSVGSLSTVPRADHIHATDTSRAADNAVVHLAGTEIVTGDKTLSGTINLSALSASQLLATNGSKNIVNTTVLPNGTTATTQAVGDDSTKVATTAFVHDVIGTDNYWAKINNTILPVDLLNDVQVGNDHNIFTALYSERINADFTALNTDSSFQATAVGGATIADFSGTSKLDLTHSDVRYVTYDTTGVGGLATQTGAFNFLVTPNYDNAPAVSQTFFSISKGTGDNKNYIELQHYSLPGPTGVITLKIYDYTGTLQVDANFGTWYSFAGTEYEFEVDFDGMTGETRLFIDKVQLGATQTNTFVRDSDVFLLAIGQSTVFPGTNTNFAIRNFSMFDAVVHIANYTFNYNLTKLSLYEITDIKGQLLALTRPANDNSTNVATTKYVDSAAKWEVSNGSLSPVDQANPIYIGNGDNVFGASYEKSIDGDYITPGYEMSLSATAVGGANIYNFAGTPKLDLTHSDIRYIYYNAQGSASEAINTGTIKFLVTPNYNNYPAADQNFISISNGIGTTVNYINLLHIQALDSDQGKLHLAFTDHTGTIQLTVFLGLWLPTINTEYEFELNYDIHGDIRLFIDGAQFGTTNTVSFTRDSNIGVLLIGRMSGSDGLPNFSFRDLVIYNTVRHTADYTPGYILNKMDVYKPVDFHYGVNVQNLEVFDQQVNNEINIGDDSLIFGAEWSSTVNGDIIDVEHLEDLIAEPIGGAGIEVYSGGPKLALIHNDVRAVIFTATYGAAKAVSKGAYRMVIAPSYSNTPAIKQTFFSIGYDLLINTNTIALYHNATDGHLNVFFRDYNGVLQLSGDFGIWQPTAAQSYVFELNFDVVYGATRLFIDGIQKGSTLTQKLTRTNTNHRIMIGQDMMAEAWTNVNFAISKFMVFDDVQHASNYDPTYTLNALNVYKKANFFGSVYAPNMTTTTPTIGNSSDLVATTSFVGGTFNVQIPDQASIIYLSKNGNDANNGKSIDRAVQTISQAMINAAALTPSSSNNVVIKCFDAHYDSNITLEPYTHFDAPMMELRAANTVKDNCILVCRYIHIVGGGIAIYFTGGTGAGPSWLIAERMGSDGYISFDINQGEKFINVGIIEAALSTDNVLYVRAGSVARVAAQRLKGLITADGSGAIADLREVSDLSQATFSAINGGTILYPTSYFWERNLGVITNAVANDTLSMPCPVLPNLTLYSDFSASPNASFSGGSSVGTLGGSAAIADGYLDLAHDNNAKVVYLAASNADFAQTGTVNFLCKPAYSGTPPGVSYPFFSIGTYASLNNFLMLMHYYDGTIILSAYDSTGTVIINVGSFGSWSPVANQEYEFELDFDIASGATILFIDKSQFGSTLTQTGTRTSGSQSLAVGDTIFGLNLPVDFKIRKFCVFNAVKHTADYTESYNYPAITSNGTVRVNELLAVGDVSTGGHVYVSDTTEASATAASINTLGGISTQKKLYIGTALNLPVNSGGTRTDLGKYERATSISLDFTGPWTGTVTVTAICEQIGHITNFYLPVISATGDSTTAFIQNSTTTIPARFRPLADQTTTCVTNINVTKAVALITIGADGSVTISNSAGGQFSPGTDVISVLTDSYLLTNT